MKNDNNKKLMLLIIMLMMLIMTMISMSGCGNMAVLDPGTFTFSHVHFSDGIKGYCYDIDKWHENDRGVEVETENGKGIFLSESTYQLFESKSSCPYC